MREEIMLVLQLLENGKINAEEAEKLLNALRKDKACGNPNREEFSANFEKKVNKISSQMGEFAKDMGQKIDKLAKDLEPKIKESAKIIASKASSTVEEISRTFKKEETDEGNDKSDFDFKTKDETESDEPSSASDFMKDFYKED